MNIHICNKLNKFSKQYFTKNNVPLMEKNILI